ALCAADAPCLPPLPDAPVPLAVRPCLFVAHRCSRQTLRAEVWRTAPHTRPHRVTVESVSTQVRRAPRDRNRADQLVGDPLRSTSPSVPGDHSTQPHRPDETILDHLLRFTPTDAVRHSAHRCASYRAVAATPPILPAHPAGRPARLLTRTPMNSGPALGSGNTVTQVGGPYTKDKQYGYRYRQVVQR